MPSYDNDNNNDDNDDDDDRLSGANQTTPRN